MRITHRLRFTDNERSPLVHAVCTCGAAFSGATLTDVNRIFNAHLQHELAMKAQVDYV